MKLMSMFNNKKKKEKKGEGGGNILTKTKKTAT
jgi:hypothetical protein